jgi:hypothetical protein
MLFRCLFRSRYKETGRFTQDLHGATSQKTAFFIVTPVKTSNLTHKILVLFLNILTLNRPLKLFSPTFMIHRGHCKFYWPVSHKFSTQSALPSRTNLEKCVQLTGLGASEAALCCYVKDKAILVTGREGPYGCEMSRLPRFLDNPLTDGGKVVSLTLRPSFTPQEIFWYSLLLEAESIPGP